MKIILITIALLVAGCAANKCPIEVWDGNHIEEASLCDYGDE